MKAKILFKVSMILFFIIIMGSVTGGPILTCTTGNVIWEVGGNGRTATQECIDAGYPGCEFYCCWAWPTCVNVQRCPGPPWPCCLADCNADFGGGVCCSAIVTPEETVNTFLCQIVLILWSITAGIATLVITLAGIKWMGSEDDLAARREAKITIIHAIIGLIIVLIALTIVNWVFAGAGPMSVFTFNCAP